MADRNGELISLAPGILGNGTPGWHLAQLSAGLHTNTLIRQAIFRRKYTIKFLNNVIAQLTPFFFYAIGGALVIAGRLDFGALVAVIAACTDLAGPWTAVLGYVQRLSDFTARYRFVRESVAVEGGIEPRTRCPGPGRTAQRRSLGQARRRGSRGGSAGDPRARPAGGRADGADRRAARHARGRAAAAGRHRPAR